MQPVTVTKRERGVKPQIGIRTGRGVRGRLRFCVGLGSEPDDGARTWPLWPCRSAPQMESVRFGRVFSQICLPQRQFDVEFEEDLGAELEVADHDMGFLFIEAGVEVGGDDHY